MQTWENLVNDQACLKQEGNLQSHLGYKSPQGTSELRGHPAHVPSSDPQRRPRSKSSPLAYCRRILGQVNGAVANKALFQGRLQLQQETL